jgi:hypothetical protein
MASLIGPALFTQIFAASISTHAEWKLLPGAAFLASTLLVLVAMVLAWRATQPPPLVSATDRV